MDSQSHYRGVAKDNSTIIPPKNGSKTFMVKPKAMDIIWGADSRYWRLPNSDEGPVELLQVSWLEVTSSLDLEKLEAKDYKLSFTVSMRPDAFGWKGSPVYFMARVGEGKIMWKKADLSELPVNTDHKIPAELKFTVTTKDKDSTEKLRFGLYEIWMGRWKGGLVIRNVDITPVPKNKCSMFSRVSKFCTETFWNFGRNSTFEALNHTPFDALESGLEDLSNGIGLEAETSPFNLDFELNSLSFL